MKKKIFIGSDHAGFKLKQKILKKLSERYDFVDLGNHVYDPVDDYPDYAYKVAKAVVKNRRALGVLICGSSEGVCIAANKVRGIRAASGFSIKQAKLAKEHDNANVICLSGRLTSEKDNIRILKKWIETEFTGNKRHKRRLRKIAKIEKGELK